MNLQKIHDDLISRAKERVYDSSIHHRHHIMPVHEDSISNETVPLTFKEHYVVHHIRFRLVGTWQNKTAWLLIKGAMSCRDGIRTVQSNGGKTGGKTTKALGKGIFSHDYDRSAQSKENWKRGAYSHLDFSLRARLGGNTTRKNLSGIFNPDLQHLRTEWAKLGSNALKESGNMSGAYSKTWRDDNPDRVHEIYLKSIGAFRANGKVLGSKLWWNNGIINTKSTDCPGDGWVRGMLMSEKKRNQVYSALAGHNKRNNDKCQF